MDAFKNLCDRAIERYKEESGPKTRILVSEKEDFYSIDSEIVKDLCISYSRYDGEVPDDLTWCNLTHFSGNAQQLESIYERIVPENITDLSLKLKAAKDLPLLGFPKVRFNGECFSWCFWCVSKFAESTDN